jgi:hypothetical protein
MHMYVFRFPKRLPTFIARVPGFLRPSCYVGTCEFIFFWLPWPRGILAFNIVLLRDQLITDHELLGFICRPLKEERVEIEKPDIRF